MRHLVLGWLVVLIRKLKLSFVRLRWQILGRYYQALAIQARFLYRQSPLFQYRYQELGLQFALDAFNAENSDGLHFFSCAKNEPLQIRARLFLDAISGKPLHAYYISERV